MHGPHMRALLGHFTHHVIQHSAERRLMYLNEGHLDPISVFQIRTICYPESNPQFQRVGFPVPEGIHRDGMDYVGITCVNR